MKILVTGINGFIGTHFAEKAISETDWQIIGFDIAQNNLSPFCGSSRFEFQCGDIFKEEKWLEEKVAECDVVLPLAGIAKPAYYIEKPIWTFELDFEQNLKIVRMCAKHGTRIVFPSTSEVYGMSQDDELKEDSSPLVTGPISKMRWIYSTSKQMMDRMIFAYGQEENLDFTLFRPFNWMGPRLDTFADAKERKARAITQMIYDILERGHVTLVNGGVQRRSFTWIKDAIGALALIIENKNNAASGQIFNIGNPHNNYSIKEMAEMLIEEMKTFPEFKDRADKAVLDVISGDEYYGKTYDDMKNRVPSIENIEKRLGWKPTADMSFILHETLAYYAKQGV